MRDVLDQESGLAAIAVVIHDAFARPPSARAFASDLSGDVYAVLRPTYVHRETATATATAPAAATATATVTVAATAGIRTVTRVALLGRALKHAGEGAACR